MTLHSSLASVSKLHKKNSSVNKLASTLFIAYILTAGMKSLLGEFQIFP